MNGFLTNDLNRDGRAGKIIDVGKGEELGGASITINLDQNTRDRNLDNNGNSNITRGLRFNDMSNGDNNKDKEKVEVEKAGRIGVREDTTIRSNDILQVSCVSDISMGKEGERAILPFPFPSSMGVGILFLEASLIKPLCYPHLQPVITISCYVLLLLISRYCSCQSIVGIQKQPELPEPQIRIVFFIEFHLPSY
jgi:hypothetical protein